MGVIVKGRVSINYFSPLNISGLQLWLDASDSTTLFQDSAATTPALADGDPIGCWKDKSGNNYHATQTDGTFKPLRKNAIQNAKNIIRFDGTNDRLVCGNVMNMGANSLAAFIACKITSSVAQIIGKSRANYQEGRWTIYRSSGSIYLLVTTEIFPYEYFIGTTDSSTAFRVLGAIYRRNGNSVLRINKTEYGSTYTPSSTTLNTTNIAEIGAYQTDSGNEGGTSPMADDIGEILVYQAASISDADRDSIESYLMAKWGVY